MSRDDEDIMTDAGGQPQAPVVVIPGAGINVTQGLDSGAGTLAGAPMLPQAVVASDEGTGAPDNIASRIEQVLSQDGRFALLLSGLSWGADNSGHVTLTGSLPNTALKPSLLSAVRAVPGVSDVTDHTR